MRDVTFVVIMALVILALALCMAYAVIDTQGQRGQLHNAYWPFTVETVVHDR